MIGKCEHCGYEGEVESYFRMNLCDVCRRIAGCSRDAVPANLEDLRIQHLRKLQNCPHYRQSCLESIFARHWKDMLRLLRKSIDTDPEVNKFFEDVRLEFIQQSQ